MLPLMEAPSAPLWRGFFLKVWTNYRGRCRNVSRFWRGIGTTAEKTVSSTPIIF
jgi:hypothetical protein